MSVRYATQGTSYLAQSDLEAYQRVFVVGHEMRAAGSTELENGVVNRGILSGDAGAIELLTPGQRVIVIAAGAIVAESTVYRAANGRIASTGTSKFGRAVGSAGVAGDLVEVVVEASEGTPGGTETSNYLRSATKAARLALDEDITVTIQDTSGLTYAQVEGSPGTWEVINNVATTDGLANLTEPEDGQFAIVESEDSNLQFFVYKDTGGGWIEQSGLAESTTDKLFKSRADGEQPALNDISYYPAGATPDFGIDAEMSAGNNYAIVQDNGSGIHVTSSYYHDGTSVRQISQPSSYHAQTMTISGDASNYLDVTSIAAFDSATTSQQISVTIHDARKLVYGEDFTYSYVSASDKRIVWTDDVKNLLVLDGRKVLIEYWD